MTIWMPREKPPMLDKFCHLSLDAQKIMAALYRDFHRRKAELLAIRHNSLSGCQDTRHFGISMRNQYSHSFSSGQNVDRPIYSTRTDVASQDKSTYSDSPPVETQDFRLLSQFCREDNIESACNTSVCDEREKNLQCYDLNHYTNYVEPEAINQDQGCVTVENISHFVLDNRGSSEIQNDASQDLFSQDCNITVNRNNAKTPRKPYETKSCSTDFQTYSVRRNAMNYANANLAFNPFIIPVDIIRDSTSNRVQRKTRNDQSFEQSHNVKRRKTESEPSIKPTVDELPKSKTTKKMSNVKSRDIREFMKVIYPDKDQNRCAIVPDMISARTDESPSVNDINSAAAADSNNTLINYAEESPYPLSQQLNNQESNIRKDADISKTGKKLDAKTSKFKVPVKISWTQSSAASCVMNVCQLSTELLGKILTEIVESNEVILSLVYTNGSTQLRDSLFGSDKRKSLGKQKKNSDIDCIAIQNKDKVYLFPMTVSSTGLHAKLRDFMYTLLLKSDVRKVGFQVKDVFIALHKFLEIERSHVDLSWTILDSSIAAWLLDPDSPVSSFDQLLSCVGLPQQAPNESCIDALPEDMSFLSSAMQKLFQELQRKDLWTLFLCLETPLVNVLADMEMRPLTISTHTLLQFSTLLKRNLTRLDRLAHQAAGHPFVLNSHHQLRQVLFEELRLDSKIQGKAKLAKTNVTREMSTSEAVLTKLSPFHPLPGIVLEYRQLQKLKSANVDGILSCVMNDHIVTHWDQTSAATGRLTSNQPNIQAIPKAPITVSNCRENFIIGTEKSGREMIEIYARDAFIARSNCSFLAADFQQIELRLLGHLAKDPVLLKLFSHSETPDIFNALTSQWLSIPIDEVRESDRDQTKRVVYSVMYGVGKEKLSQYLKCKPDDAKAIIDSFLGYTTSIFRRRRLFPHITHRNPVLKAQAERQCVNFCVQGSAADICKAAMLQVQKTLAENLDLDARLLVQIHDELLLEVADDDLNKVAALIKSVMECREKLCGSIVQLRVPIPVSISVGKSWGHMEPWINNLTDSND